MEMSVNRGDREYQKFVETNTGLTALRVSSINSLMPKDFDSIVLTYSGSNVTQIKYYINGVTGTLVATLTLTYSGSNVISIVRT